MWYPRGIGRCLGTRASLLVRRRPFLPRLHLPRADDGILDGGRVAREIRDDHHVLCEPLGYRERLWEGLDEEVTRLERGADDDVAGVELPRHETAVIAPVEQSVAAALADTAEPADRGAELADTHRCIVACPKRGSPCPAPLECRTWRTSARPSRALVA